MPVIEQKANSIDDYALTRKKGGGMGGGSFRAQVVSTADDIAKNLPVSQETTLITEIADLVTQQDDDVYCKLLNNNTNLRCQHVRLSGLQPRNLTRLFYTPLPFSITDFNGGGMEITRKGLYNWRATANKCGVYRVSVGLHVVTNGGVYMTNPSIALAKLKPSGYNLNYSDVLWRGFGNLTEFWANGCDLIDLECGEGVELWIYHEYAFDINYTSYDFDGWIAINYTGNQH